MKIVIAPDKFKGSLTAVEAADAMALGVFDVDPGAEVVRCPMADGGEGTVEAVVAATGAELRLERVSGPLPRQEVEAAWAFLPAGCLSPAAVTGDLSGMLETSESAGVIEMAQASGLSLVLPTGRRDPLVTTTIGTGQLIKRAMDAGCAQVVVGVGGSATVDGGTGMAFALGYRFLDGRGREVAPGGGNLEEISEIDASGCDARISGTRFLVATDVDNPLTGEQGAARVYGPQKGASGEQVEQLERGLEHLGELIRECLGVDVLNMPGAGAAGGLAAGLAGFCGARITSGVEVVASVVGLEEKLAGADLVLTGEGSFDSQTTHGKAPAGVAAMASARGVPSVIIAGQVSGEAAVALGAGVGTFSIVPGPMGRDEAMTGAAYLVREGTARLVRLVFLRPGA